MGTPKKETTNHIQLKNGVDTYGRVVLTLKNCLLPEEKLSPTPSQIDGLDAETETDLRILGCELMQTAGILLKLPQVAMATAQVLFHRFYYSKSFVRQNFEITGMGCLYLASKIEEAPRRIRDVINVYHHIKQVNNQNLGNDTFSKSTANIYVVSVLILDLWCVICGRYQGIVSEPEDFVLWVLMRTITPMVLDQNYINLKYQVIKAERRVLKELGFCVHVKHPHKLIVMYLQVLGLERKQTLMQLAWNYMNDSLRTDVFVRYQPETVACACMYLTARRLKIAMPKSPPWYSIFNVEEKDIQDICLRILRLYSRPKPKAEVLEKKVQELCKKFEENRLKNKTVFSNATSGTNTPTSPSVVEKKPSPKRRSNSDRSRSRSRSASVSPRHKKAKKHKRSTSRSRSRSRSYEKKYKKSHKNNRRSRSSSPSSKNHKDKKYRSRSRSYEREYKKLPNDGKYYSDRYKEEKGFDRYYKDEKFRSKDEEKYRKDDEKYRKEEKGSSKEEDRHKKEDKHKRNEENYRKEYKEETYKNSDKNYDEDYKEERKVKYKNEDKYSREVRYLSDKSSKNDKYEEKERYNSEKYSSKEKHKSTRSDKYNSKDSEYVSKDENYGSKKDKYESDRKRKHKHRSDDEDEEDDDIEIIAVKREKKSR